MYSSEELTAIYLLNTCSKLLGITIDNKLMFEHHVPGLCHKASNKLYALSRIATFMDQGKLKYLMRDFK